LANQSFLDGLTAELQGVLLGFNAGTAGLQVFAQQTQNGAKATQFFEGVLKGVQGELSETEGAIKQLTDAEKKRKEEEKKAAELAAKRASEATAQSKKRQAELEREIKALEKIRQERTIRVTAQLEVDFQRRGNIDTSEILKKRIQETQKEVQRTAGAIQVPLKFPAVNPLGLLQNIKLAQAEFQKLKEAANLQAATNLISDTFFTPLAGLFEGLISGADNAFKEFTKAIFKAINQIVAKIIATGIISLLANLLFPGAGGVGVSLGKKVLGDIGAAFGFKTLANPNFGCFVMNLKFVALYSIFDLLNY